MKERFLSIIVFVVVVVVVVVVVYFLSFFVIRIFLSAFSHPHPPPQVSGPRFTETPFEKQEGLPAVSYLRQGFLPLTIVQPRV